MSQVGLFAPSDLATPEDIQRQVWDLLGRAFVLEVEAGEAKTERHAERLRRKAADLAEEAKALQG